MGHGHEEAFYSVNMLGTTDFLKTLVVLTRSSAMTLLAISATRTANRGNPRSGQSIRNEQDCHQAYGPDLHGPPSARDCRPFNSKVRRRGGAS